MSDGSKNPSLHLWFIAGLSNRAGTRLGEARCRCPTGTGWLLSGATCFGVSNDGPRVTQQTAARRDQPGSVAKLQVNAAEARR